MHTHRHSTGSTQATVGPISPGAATVGTGTPASVGAACAKHGRHWADCARLPWPPRGGLGHAADWATGRIWLGCPHQRAQVRAATHNREDRLASPGECEASREWAARDGGSGARAQGAVGLVTSSVSCGTWGAGVGGRVGGKCGAGVGQVCGAGVGGRCGAGARVRVERAREARKVKGHLLNYYTNTTP